MLAKPFNKSNSVGNILGKRDGFVVKTFRTYKNGVL